MIRQHLISNPDDPRIADYRALTDVELRTRWEPPNGLLIADGELVLRRALRAGYQPRCVLVDVKRVDELPDVGDAPVYAGTQNGLGKATGFRVHRGLFVSLHREPARDADEVLAGVRRVAILEDVNNDTNVGAILRGAAAPGRDAVLVSSSGADPQDRTGIVSNRRSIEC